MLDSELQSLWIRPGAVVELIDVLETSTQISFDAFLRLWRRSRGMKMNFLPCHMIQVDDIGVLEKWKSVFLYPTLSVSDGALQVMDHEHAIPAYNEGQASHRYGGVAPEEREL